MMDIEQQIRLRAYEIWVATGMGEGDAERHWLQAESAVNRKSASARPKAAKKPAIETKSAASTKPATSLKSAKPAAEAKATTPRRTMTVAASERAEASA